MFYEAITRNFGESDLWGLIVLSLAAFLVAFLTSLFVGKHTIAWLIKQGVKDGEARKASETLNEINAGKERTPTMGGIFIIITLLFVGMLFLPLKMHAGWMVLAAMIGSAALGMVDDWTKLTRSDRDGISSKTKLLAQSILYGVCAYGIFALAPETAQVLHIPLLNANIPTGWGAIAIGVVVAVGSSNAVNLADGLDGLAGGMTVMTMMTLAIVGGLLSAEAFSGGGILRAEDAMAVSLLATLTAGATLGFLWFNAHPAQVFMGDTGSLALGAGLGMMAVALRQEILLAVVAATFVAEAGSVIVQVGWFKISKGKRVFRCAPLHHHFQFGGVKESKVTLRFWMACALFCIVGLAIFASSLQITRPTAENGEASAPIEMRYEVPREIVLHR